MKRYTRKINAGSYSIIFDRAINVINQYVEDHNYSKVFILVDSNTFPDCLELMASEIDFEFELCIIPAGEIHKNISTATTIWETMIDCEIDRHSLMINIGGGVIGDMGGFCASTYMRGIDFIQVPTTLLAQVDASVGGKLGIDLHNYKNMVGMFCNPKLVIIDPRFLKTLDDRELKSGFAELLKHGLIKDENLWEKNNSTPIENIDWTTNIYESVTIKKDVVTEDPFEKGERKILNFGHTIGHAIESELMDTKDRLLHGEAIAIGMICASYLSHLNGHLSIATCDLIKKNFMTIYPGLPRELPSEMLLIERMKRDKKNKGGVISFTLLKKIGMAIYDQKVSIEDISKSIRYYLK